MARAAKPLGVADFGCGVKLPNSCLPLWTSPSAPGNARNALLEFAAVQPICIGWPVPEMSNETPPAALVKKNPLPLTSTMTGLTHRTQHEGFVLSGFHPEGQP